LNFGVNFLYQKSTESFSVFSLKNTSGAAGAALAHGPGKTTNTAARLLQPPHFILQNPVKTAVLPFLPPTVPM
jgi:hypothetical protein